MKVYMNTLPVTEKGNPNFHRKIREKGQETYNYRDKWKPKVNIQPCISHSRLKFKENYKQIRNLG